MGKYKALYDDIFTIFGQATWIATGIKTLPGNFVGTDVGNEYIRVGIVASGASLVNLPRSVSGQLIIDIFVPGGGGIERITTIADKLDEFLAGKTRKTGALGSTQLGNSAMAPLGADQGNQSLFRASYSIPFNYFGK